MYDNNKYEYGIVRLLFARPTGERRDYETLQRCLLTTMQTEFGMKMSKENCE